MPKILIYKAELGAGQQYDIYDKCDNKSFYEKHLEQYGAVHKDNYGNKLWFQAIISIIDTPENEIYYYEPMMLPEYINSEFDFIIYPMANIFNEYFADYIDSSVNFLKQIKIPTYIIACGAQADSYDCLDRLVEKIGDKSKRFIDSVYNTGGEFALRGYFTKEFFDRLGNNTAMVTGCPSIYQMGRNLRIDNTKVSKEEFKPLFNGEIGIKHCRNINNSFFIDQETYFEYLYNLDFNINKINSKYIFNMIKIYGYDNIALLFSNRIKLFVSMNEWYNFIKKYEFNFSYGSRIHGNIMPILSGVPALIYPKDSRVKEMAEFYSIPIADVNSKSSIYEQYLATDYSEFNNNFPKKFDLFEKFLTENGIVTKINQDNSFLFDKSYDFDNVNSENLEKLNKIFSGFKFSAYNKLLSIIRKLR